MKEWFIMHADGSFLAMESEGEETCETHFGAVGFESYQAVLLAASALVAGNTPLPVHVCHVDSIQEKGAVRFDVVIDLTLSKP